jgi:amino acid adenylation domain-containing protein
MSSTHTAPRLEGRDTAMSLYHLLDPQVLANPYPLFRRMRSEDPVHWDPFLHAWVVTRYADVLEVLLNFSADRTPTPAQLDEMGLSSLNPIARVMVKQMLFLDAPAHTRLRGLSSKAFMPARVEQLRVHIQDITKNLLDGVQAGLNGNAEIDVIAQLAEPLPAIVTAEMLGVPTGDHLQLKKWSADFAEMLGNFQHNPERYPRVLEAVSGMTEYFQNAIREQRAHPHAREGLIHSLLTAEIDGDRLTEEEVIANCIVTMVGGQETTTNLIGNGLLTLLRNPGEMERLRNDYSLIPSAVEEMLRYESPSQHTARMCPLDREMGGKLIQKRQAVIAVMAAANRDPERFPDPDRFDIARKDNRHLAFGYAAHFCFGAPLARVEGQVVLEAFLRRFANVTLATDTLEWRSNLGLRGLKALNVKVGEAAQHAGSDHAPRKSETKPAAAASGCPYEAQAAHDRLGENSGDKQALIRKYLQSRTSHRADSAPAIPRRSASGPAPLSFAQEQIWLHCQFAKDLYNESVTVYRRGPLDVPALRRSLAEMIRRHEAWRTTFQVIGGQPVQIVHPPYELNLEVVDLRNLTAEQREAEALRLGRERARIPFDMERGPLLRAMLVQFGDEDHRLYLFLHHIIFDGFSMYNVFLPELVAVYQALLAGQASPLAELPLQYADFAQWQRASLDEAQLNESRAYWSSQLDGEIPVLELPTDRPRPALQSFRGAMHRFAFPKSLSERLHQLANREQASFFTTILAGFVALLRRYSAQEDFVLGTVTSGRKHTELETLLGCFQNPLALRLKLTGDPSFRELLTHTREVTLSALSHDSAPFERLVEELSVRRDTSRNPVFPVMFSLVPPTPAFAAGWDLNQLDLEIGTAKFDLDLELDDRPAGLQGRFVYCTDLFEPATIERMVGHFQTMLEGIVADPEQTVSRLPMLSAAEQRQFAQWNSTETSYPRERCMHELVEAQVVRTPNSVAVEHASVSLTYLELNQRANQLAHFLAKRGIGPESKVGICLRRSLELPVALLAVLKAGAACVPLDPAYPKERLTYMLEDSQTPLVLTQAGLLAEVTDFDAEVVNLDADWKLFAGESREEDSRENLRSGVKPENLAYVIYTSGSTGKPRGVLLTHGGLVNHNVAAAQLFGMSTADRMAQFASISFDIAVEEIFPTWIAGGALVVREEDASLAVGDFLRWVREKRVTALDLPTAYWHELVRELSESALRLPESLRIVIVGGEKASSAALTAWRKIAGPRVRWVNTYGPTETSVIVTSFEPKAAEEIPAVLPIGGPIANTKIYILDKNLQPQPVGIAGDLYVSGPGLARGYLNRPETTAEKFVRDPFRNEPDARMYKTGDLARYLASGEIEFAGRTDDQVKIRGYRVELEEIEAVLGSHAGVREVVVAALENAAGEKTLAAYVVPSREQVPTASELRLYLKQKLPHYMVPSAFVLLEAMPKTPNGKVDKRALPAPKASDFAEPQEYVAPTDELETQLTKIWETVLDKKPVGIRDNFFELGGHSLLAARLMHRIEQSLGQRLPLAALLQAPTVEQLAGLLRQEKWSSSWSSLVEIQPEGSRPPFFCVHGVGGNVVGFRDLALHLGADQPFYALQPQGLDGKRPCLTSTSQMAERYIQEIRRVQPEGPYRIGGYSFGGLVAYEMAQQLEAQGEDTALLALFDTYPGKVESRGSQLKNLFGLPLKEQASFVFKKGSFVLMTLRKRLELQMLPRALRNVRQACSKAAGDYDVKPYSGRVTLFRVKEKSVGSLNDPYAIWWRVASEGVDLREISGDHLSLLKEPQVRLLAEQLGDCLEQSLSESALVATGT